jgi:hypothetical protein
VDFAVFSEQPYPLGNRLKSSLNKKNIITWNQSMVQQLISEGNILNLFLNASPIGLIAKTTWRFCLTRSMKKLYIARGVASIFLPCYNKNNKEMY